MNKIDQIFKESHNIQKFSKAYFKYLGSVLEKINVDDIAKFCDALMKARENESSIYFIGNGGSAATASHFANDIAIGTKMKNKAFRAISLCDNQAVITAIGNDYGYEFIFSKQLDVVLNENDIVVAISASGNSSNLIHALTSAKEKSAITIGITAFDGGQLSQQVDINVHVPTNIGEYGPAEDAHMVLDHLVSNYLMKYMKTI